MLRNRSLELGTSVIHSTLHVNAFIYLTHTDAKKHSMGASRGNLIYAYKAQAAIAKTTDKPMAIEFTTETEVTAPAPVPLGAAVPDC